MGLGSSYNEKTFNICRPVLEELLSKNVDFIIFGGFAIYLNTLNYTIEKGQGENRDIFRETEDIDIISKSVIESIKSIENILEIYLDDKESIKNILKYANNSDGQSIELPEERGIDIVSKIQGLSAQDINFIEIEHKGLQLKVATPEILLKMKVKMVELYGVDGVRKKDIEDIGVLKHIVEANTTKNVRKKGMLWR